MNKSVIIKLKLTKELESSRFISKFGAHAETLASSNFSHIYDQLKNLDVTYVVFGIPERMGLLANRRSEDSTVTWEATHDALLNLEANTFTNPKAVLLLGHLEVFSEVDMSKLNSKKKQIAHASMVTERVNVHVSQLIYQIVSAGKKPIIIGGEHNNTYGIIKGCALARNKPINVINVDAYSGFMTGAEQHSGNAFSHAYAEGFLNRYFNFGIQERLNSDQAFKRLSKLKRLAFISFEALCVRQEMDFEQALNMAEKHLEKTAVGIELSGSAMANVLSKNSSGHGFSDLKIRQLVHYFSKHRKAHYLHICEVFFRQKNKQQAGALVANLIVDFMQTQQS